MSTHYKELENCAVCPQNCGVNRYDSTGFCGAGSSIKLNLAQLHHGEEPVLSGTRGSGTIFFSHCNLRCVFCQNYPISHNGWGEERSEEDCASLMILLEQSGAHNINLVSPTQYTPQLIKVISIAREWGLDIPIVWNSNAYEHVHTLQKLEGLVDVYLPDFKYAHGVYSKKYSFAANYPEIAINAIREMYRQVGNLKNGKDGLARKGLLVRHLVLPNKLSGTREALNMLYDSFGADLSLSLMAQYYPAGEADNYPELQRNLSEEEYEEVLEIAENLGFYVVYVQDLQPSPEWTPDFQPSAINEAQEDLHFRGR
jgi:putative pyruvate formate lyase activating enzyme